jgi:predicted hotdog family 3-hydroxylacyl-ACP dehydratase
MPLDHEWIEQHIPHKGRMCLLDAVLSWDATRIRCRSASHRTPDNPLRAHGRLGAACGIEYAAQAMAVHGALLGASQDRPRAGFLTSVRDIDAQTGRLDTLDGPLNVTAERLSGNGNTILYRFVLQCDERSILSGRATVMLDASGATLTAARALSAGL